MHRCVSKQRVTTPNDMSMSGGNPDFSLTPRDMARPNNPPDFSIQPPTMTGCAGLLQCINSCAPTDMTCPTTCEGNATANGNSLFQTLINCLLTACPNTSSTDVCFDPNSAQCAQCFMDAQDPTLPGACVQPLTNCNNNLP